MQTRTGIAAGAMRAFFDSADPNDEAFLLSVSSRPDTLSAFTNDFGSLEAGLLGAQRGGATALVDTICLGLRRMRAARNKHKALLIISDGMDNHSRYSVGELMRLAEEADVQIYTIGMTPSMAGRKPIELTEERNGLAFLAHLAARTGGLSFTLASYEDPAPIASRISRAIRNQYLIGYRPVETAEPGKWRPIRVRVSLPQVSVSSRAGYYSR
jgi:VWFA-related protein